MSGTKSVKQFIAEGAAGKLGVRERDCACDPCMHWNLSACEMAELTQSKRKSFAVTASKGWAEVVMELKQEAGVAAGGRKRKRGESDSGWQVKEKQLHQALLLLVDLFRNGSDEVTRQLYAKPWLLAAACR